MKKYFISGAITIILGLLINFLVLPALNFSSNGFWLFIVLEAFVFAFTLTTINSFSDESLAAYLIGWGIVIVLCLTWIFIAFFSSRIFNSNKYANIIKVEEKSIENIPEVKDIKRLALMDTVSAKMLGDRTMGTLTELVSQYDVSDNYYTVEINGEMFKIAPLEYSGFWKYRKNKYNGIPGYVKVNPITSEAELVSLEKGFKVSPSSFFGNDLDRTLRKQYPGLIFQDKTFQVDDEGNVFWVAPFKEKGIGAHTITGVVILDAFDGSSQYYALNDVPKWVDLVFSGEELSSLYKDFGTLQNGYWNSLTSKVGGKVTTDDYGYLLRDGDIYIYTGITSVASDESNLGFIIVNTRSGEYEYYSIPGAEEYSAMSAAEGQVQQFGYKASFPSLINISGEPTYVMVLKDAAGLVKMYAMVNVRNYTIVSTEDTLSKVLSSYNKALVNNGKSTSIISENMENSTFVISDIQFVVTGGETIVYIKGGNKIYKQDFSANESLISLEIGDKVTVSYDKDESNKEIILIVSFK